MELNWRKAMTVTQGDVIIFLLCCIVGGLGRIIWLLEKTVQ